LEQVLEEDAYSHFKTWARTDRLLEDKNWMTFNIWAKKTWDGRARRRNLFKAALKLNMVDSGLSVAEYFNKFQENPRLSGKHMSDEDKITTLKDGLRPDIQKAVIFMKFDTVRDLREAALEVEACDATEKKKIAPRHKTRLENTWKPAKDERIDPTRCCD
jgi:hypothetical protein